MVASSGEINHYSNNNYSIMSKSFNNPMAITALRKHFADVTRSMQGSIQTDLEAASEPFKKETISKMIN